MVLRPGNLLFVKISNIRHYPSRFPSIMGTARVAANSSANAKVRLLTAVGAGVGPETLTVK